MKYQAITHDILVRVEPHFVTERSDPSKQQYFWAYEVHVTNQSQRTVQLVRRHWIITDGRGQTHDVKGAGVVGEEPIIPPGETFGYTSGCPLDTPGGFMVGSYTMVGEDGTHFDIAIPAFSLDVPQTRRTLN